LKGKIARRERAVFTFTEARMPAFRLRPNMRSGHSETTLVRTAVDLFQGRPGSGRECAYRRIVPNLAYGSIHDGNDGRSILLSIVGLTIFCRFFFPLRVTVGSIAQHADITRCPSF
jgi:hypothetical protein